MGSTNTNRMARRRERSGDMGRQGNNIRPVPDLKLQEKVEKNEGIMIGNGEFT